jgi:hypothetical protein
LFRRESALSDSPETHENNFILIAAVIHRGAIVLRASKVYREVRSVRCEEIDLVQKERAAAEDLKGSEILA